MKIGFDNDKYLKEQSEEIRRRAGKYGRLYLEFGGKLMNDFHAARCLPGYHPNVKLRLLQSLKDQAEVVLCIYSGDIEKKKMRADFGISYADDALKLIDDLTALGLPVRGVVITRYEGQLAAQQFSKKLESRGVKCYFHGKTLGYPADVDTVVSEEGYGKNPYVPVERSIVVVTAPGPGSGKFATCLNQIYHEYRQGKVAGYSKFESFPVCHDRPERQEHDRSVPPRGVRKDHRQLQPRRGRVSAPQGHLGEDDEGRVPLQVADGHGREPHRLRNRRRRGSAGGVEAGGHPTLHALPVPVRGGRDGHRERVGRAKMLMDSLGLKTENRLVALAARGAAETARLQGKGKDGGRVVSAAALQLHSGEIVTGRNSDELHACSAVILNAVKKLAGIPDRLPLLAPTILQSIAHMKHDILKGGYTSLNLDEALIALAISATTNPAAQLAMEKLGELSTCEVHMTHMVTPGDEAGLRRLACRYTSDPYYASNQLFTGAQ